jgi:hypothetical protein
MARRAQRSSIVLRIVPAFRLWNDVVNLHEKNLAQTATEVSLLSDGQLEWLRERHANLTL